MTRRQVEDSIAQHIPRPKQTFDEVENKFKSSRKELKSPNSLRGSDQHCASLFRTLCFSSEVSLYTDTFAGWLNPSLKTAGSGDGL